jgi:prolyl-tRNA synthetase
MESLGIAGRTDVAGVFTMHSSGVRLRSRISDIVRRAYDRHGFSQVQYPVLQDRRIWEASGRWDLYNDAGTLFPVLDGNEPFLCLAPTSEEVAVADAGRYLRSYRDLPARVWLTTSKFRNEVSPRGGLMRSREFEMADGYSFDIDPKGAIDSYQLLRSVCGSALREIGFASVFECDADGGDISDGESSEFLVLGDIGQSVVFTCPYCGARGDAEAKRVIDGSEVTCARCGCGTPRALPATELAHIFALGTRYSAAMGLAVPSASGQPVHPHMTCSGIGVTRCIQVLAHQSRDDRGFAWPAGMAPYDVLIVLLRQDDQQARDLATSIADAISRRGLDVLVDDSESSPGKKFAFADALGSPSQIVVSPRDYQSVEVRDRRTRRTAQVAAIDVPGALASQPKW